MKNMFRGAVLTGLLGVFMFGAITLVGTGPAVAGKPGSGGGGSIGGCPRQGIYCLDVWQPVICSNGVVYSNSCYAYVACATGCVPYGGDTQ
jgi:hypothetical protein